MKKNNALVPKEVTGYPEIKVCFREFVSDFLAEADLKPNTLASYSNRLEIFLRFLEREKIRLPKPIDIVNYKRYLISSLKSSNTTSNYITALKSLFLFLENTRRFPNVCLQLRSIPRPKGHRKSALSLDEARTLLGSMPRLTLKDKRNFFLAKLMISVGTRVCEAYSSDLRSISIENGVNVLWIKGKNKMESDEKVALANGVYSALMDYLDTRERELGLALHQPLFISLSSNCMGNRLSKRTLSGLIKKQLRFIGLDRSSLTAHSCRHTALSLAIINNSLVDVKSLARHASPVTTMLYIHRARFTGHVEKSIDDLIEGKSED